MPVAVRTWERVDWDTKYASHGTITLRAEGIDNPSSIENGEIEAVSGVRVVTIDLDQLGLDREAGCHTGVAVG